MDKKNNIIDRDIFNAIKKSHKGYWYYTVPTYIRRNGQMRISNKKYEQLKAKYGNKER